MAILPPDARGVRMDRAIHRMLSQKGRTVSVREVRTALQRGEIRIDDRSVPPGQSARGGERVDASRFVARADAVITPAPRTYGAKVVAEDRDLLVLDKPAGLPTMPLHPAERETLLHVAVAVAPSVAEAGPPLEGGLVHRLDTGTSGLVLFAKSGSARQALRAAFGAQAVEKQYLALTVAPAWSEARSDGRIAGRGRRVRVLSPEAAEGLMARTLCRVVARGDARAWVQAETRTGRRHQVRAHLSHLEAPLYGDPLYGGPQAPRLGLHASAVRLPDGRVFRVPLPPDLTALLEAP